MNDGYLCMYLSSLLSQALIYIQIKPGRLFPQHAKMSKGYDTFLITIQIFGVLPWRNSRPRVSQEPSSQNKILLDE